MRTRECAIGDHRPRLTGRVSATKMRSRGLNRFGGRRRDAREADPYAKRLGACVLCGEEPVEHLYWIAARALSSQPANRVAELEALVEARDWSSATAILEFDSTKDQVEYVALKCPLGGIGIKRMLSLRDVSQGDRLLADVVIDESSQATIAAIAEGQWHPVRQPEWLPTDVPMLEGWRLEIESSKRTVARRGLMSAVAVVLSGAAFAILERAGAARPWVVGAAVITSIALAFVSVAAIRICSHWSMRRTVRKDLEDARRFLRSQAG